MLDDSVYTEYVKILEEELVPAMGCTEPIAVAYCTALVRRALGALPESVDVRACRKPRARAAVRAAAQRQNRRSGA